MPHPPRFSRDDWLAWRARGWSTRIIARHLSLSPSRVNQIARKHGRTKDTDVLYHHTKPGPLCLFDAETESAAYALGLLWGTASLVSSTVFLIRHRDPTLVALLQDLLGLSG